MSDSNAADDVLGVATGDEILHGADLQASIDALLAMSRSYDAQLKTATEVEDLQAIGAAQSDLNNQAMTLVTAQVKLMAGGALVTADHINAATKYAEEAIDAMKDWRKKIAATGKVIDFCGAVLSGDGLKMVEAAVKLKGAF